MNRQELRAASAIGLLYLVRMLGLFMALPVLPLAADDIPGATALLIGVALGAHGLTQSLLQIPFGLMSDRFGRKPMLALGLCLFSAGSFIAGFSDDIHGLLVGRFLQGCGAIAGVLLALMSDLTRIEQRARAMAIIGVAIAGAFGLSLVLGPLVAGAFGVQGVFHLSGLLGLAGLGLLLWTIPSPQVMSNNLDAAVQRGRLAAAMSDLRLWRVNFSAFCLHFLLVSCFSVFPLLFLRIGQIPAAEHALYYLALLTAAFLLMSPLMWLFDRWREVRPALTLMLGLCLAAFFLLAGVEGYGALLTGVLLLFMGFNLLEVALPAQVGKLAGAGARGTSMGVYAACQFLGIFAGGVVSGWLLATGDIALVMYANIALIFLWLPVCLTFPRCDNLGSRTFPLGAWRRQTAKAPGDGLLSINGVLDAVVIEAEQVVYLKVDERVFDDDEFRRLVRADNACRGRAPQA